MIKICDCTDKFNYTFKHDIIFEIEEELKNNKCCSEYPNCRHPSFQTTADFFDRGTQRCNYLRDVFFECVDGLYNPNDFEKVGYRGWAMKRLKGECNDGEWHNHKDITDRIKLRDEKDGNTITLSSVFYVNETTLGTEFEDEHMYYKIKPKLFHWYIFSGMTAHRPENGWLKDDRYIIAADIVLTKK